MNGPVLANHSLHVRFAILLPAMNVEDVKNEVLKEEDMVKSEEGSQEDLGLKRSSRAHAQLASRTKLAEADVARDLCLEL